MSRTVWKAILGRLESRCFTDELINEVAKFIPICELPISICAHGSAPPQDDEFNNLFLEIVVLREARGPSDKQSQEGLPARNRNKVVQIPFRLGLLGF